VVRWRDRKLCDRCEKIDFSVRLGPGGPHATRARLAAQLGKLQELDPVCPFCCFLKSMVPALSAAYLGINLCYKLCVFSSLETFTWPGGIHRNLVDTCLFGLYPDRLPEGYDQRSEPGLVTRTGYIIPILPASIPPSPAFGGRLLKDTQVDFELLKSWIGFCEGHHSKRCNAAIKKESPARRVIDCKTRQIIQMPARCPYIALSYVWGPSTYN
jgi:hypothetical protein